jgi:hypothetical protein
MGKNVNKLSARKVASINKAGLYGDGMGLWLKVTKSGTKSWIFRYTQNKKTVDLGLGSIITVSSEPLHTSSKIMTVYSTASIKVIIFQTINVNLEKA